jgi:short-subunit dehydrogenase
LAYTGGVTDIHLDVTNAGDVQRLADTLAERDICIDAFVYSAGFSMAAPFEVTKERDYRYLFEVNFFGFARILQKILPLLKADGGGRVVAVSSMGALFPVAFDAFYSAGKAALNMLVRALSVELNPCGVYLTAVMPGGTATGFTRSRKVYPRELTAEYEAALGKAAAALAETEQGGMAAEAVADCIIGILKKKKPPLTAAAGVKNKAFKLAHKLLPESVTARINKRMYHLK